MKVSTRADFLVEVVRFRQLFGSRDFMKGPAETRDAAVSGLGHLYLNAEGITSKDGELFAMTMDEYARRLTMLGET